MRTRRRAPVPLVAAAGLVAALALLPLAYLVLRTLQAGPKRVAEILLRPRTLELIAASLGLAAAVTLACLVLGVAQAWLVVRSDLPGRRVLGVLAALPLAVPTYVAAYAWLSFEPGFAGFWAAFTVLTLCCTPYVYLPVAATLRRADPAVEEVARALGRGPVRAFAEATLPQARPAAAAGGLLVALYVLSDFGAVSLLRFDTFTRVIYVSYRASFDRTPAAVLALVLVALTLLIVWGEARARGAQSAARRGPRGSRMPTTLALGRVRTPALVGAWGLAALGVGVPMASLVLWLGRGSSRAGVRDFAEALGATVSLGLLGAAVTTLLALPVALLAARHAGRASRIIERSVWAAHALPGIVVALSLVFLSVNLADPLYQTTALLVLAYAVLFLPAAAGSIRSAIEQSPPVLEEVSRSLGRGPMRTAWLVTLPLALPGIGAGAALVLLTVMKELPATLLLRPTGVETLATRLWAETGAGQFAAAAPYALALIVVAAVPTLVLVRDGAGRG